MFDLQQPNSSFPHIQTDNSWPTNSKTTWLLIKTKQTQMFLITFSSHCIKLGEQLLESRAMSAESCLPPAKMKLGHFTQLTKTNKSCNVTRSRVPSSCADDDNQLNWNPYCPPLTWKSLTPFLAFISGIKSSDCILMPNLDSHVARLVGAAVRRQINDVVRWGSAEVQATAVHL